MRVFWLEAQPWDYVGGAAVSLFACSHDLSPIVHFGGGEFLPVVDGGPVFTTTVFDGTFTGRADSARGDIALLANFGDIDSWASLAWQGRPVQIYSADVDVSRPSAPVWPTTRTKIFDGLSESFDPDEAVVHLVMRPPEGKVASATYAGTGGAAGAASLKGIVKPYAAGTHTNRPAKLIDATKLLFQVHGYGPIAGFDYIRERGIKLDQPFIDHATSAALLAATVQPTEIRTCLAEGMFRLGFVPLGDITADFRGATRAGHFDTALAEVVYSMLLASGWNSANVDMTSINAVITAIPQPVQFFDDSGMDIVSAMSSLLAPAGCYWDIDELGVFYVGSFTIAGSEDFVVGDEGLGDFDMLDVDYLPTRAPFWKTRVGYAQNPSTMTFADTEAGATAEQLALITALQADVGNKIDVYYQTTAPIGVDGDQWYDTDDQLWYRRSGGAWVLTRDIGIGQAITAAGGAQATADGKITTFFGDATPTAGAVGDLWVKATEVPKIVRRWSGLAWVPVATYGADVNGQLVDSGNGGVTVPRTDVITPLGVAGGVVGSGPFLTLQTPVAVVLAPNPNLFPWPRGTLDGRTPAQIGWNNAVGWGVTVTGSLGMNMGNAASLGGGYYQWFRTVGAATTIYPYFDIFLGFDHGTVPFSFSMAGYTEGGAVINFYAEFRNAANTVTLGSMAAIYNTVTQRYEVSTSGAPAGTYYVRIVASAFFPATSATQQGLTFYAIKFEKGYNVTPYTDATNVQISGSQIGWSNGAPFYSLQPQEGGANATEGRVAAGIVAQTDWATFTGLTAVQNAARVANLDSGGNLASLNNVANRRLTLLRRADNVTALAEVDVITPLGIAAGFIGSGPFAVEQRSPDALFGGRANLLRNGGFRLLWQNWIPSGNWGVTNQGGNEGPYAVNQVAGTQVVYSENIDVYNGAAYSFQCEILASLVTAGGFVCDVEFLSAGTPNGNYSPRITAQPNTGWQRRRQPFTAGGSQCRLRFFTEGVNSGAVCAIRRIKLSADDLDVPFTDEKTDGSALAQGYGQINGQTNLPPIAAMNLRYKFTGVASYSAAAGTPATATITVSSGSMLLGDETIAYNSMSANVTGTNNTTTTFFLYLDDPTFSGGSKTLIATSTGNTLFGSRNRVYIGQIDVLFPFSGTGTGSGGSGGGGTGYCVDALAYVRTPHGPILAADVLAGDLIWGLRLDGEGGEWLRVLGNSVAPAPAWQLRAEGEATLRVSVHTPLEMRDGETRYPPTLAGGGLAVEDRAGFRWEPVNATDLGCEINVAHISVGGRVYAAGTDPDAMIYTHNPAKP